MRITTSVLSILVLMTSIVGCKDDDDLTLPPVTVKGANTFGCRVNGVIYVPGGTYGDPVVDASSDRIIVYGSQQKVNFQLTVIDTLDEPIVANKAYYFNQDNIRCVFEDLRSKAGCSYLETPVTGYIKFAKIDFDNHIFSGVFQFTAYSSACRKSVDITEGRFDISESL